MFFGFFGLAGSALGVGGTGFDATGFGTAGAAGAIAAGLASGAGASGGAGASEAAGTSIDGMTGYALATSAREGMGDGAGVNPNCGGAVSVSADDVAA
jgi:hypothetical protein